MIIVNEIQPYVTLLNDIDKSSESRHSFYQQFMNLFLDICGSMWPYNYKVKKKKKKRFGSGNYYFFNSLDPNVKKKILKFFGF